MRTLFLLLSFFAVAATAGENQILSEGPAWQKPGRRRSAQSATVWTISP